MTSASPSAAYPEKPLCERPCKPLIQHRHSRRSDWSPGRLRGVCCRWSLSCSVPHCEQPNTRWLTKSSVSWIPHPARKRSLNIMWLHLGQRSFKLSPEQVGCGSVGAFWYGGPLVWPRYTVEPRHSYNYMRAPVFLLTCRCQPTTCTPHSFTTCAHIIVPTHIPASRLTHPLPPLKDTHCQSKRPTYPTLYCLQYAEKLDGVSQLVNVLGQTDKVGMAEARGWDPCV